jgi:hypothetical protein
MPLGVQACRDRWRSTSNGSQLQDPTQKPIECAQLTIPAERAAPGVLGVRTALPVDRHRCDLTMAVDTHTDFIHELADDDLSVFSRCGGRAPDLWDICGQCADSFTFSTGQPGWLIAAKSGVFLFQLPQLYQRFLPLLL